MAGIGIVDRAGRAKMLHNMTKKIHFLAIVIILSMAVITDVDAVTISVNTKSELESAIASINPGDTISVENGTYTNWGLVTILATKDCTQSQPCTITAQTKGSVIFSGQNALNIDLRAKWWIISKLQYNNPVLSGGCCGTTNGSGSIVTFDGAQDSIIDDFKVNNVTGNGVAFPVIKVNGVRDTLRNTLQNSWVDGFAPISGYMIYVYARSEQGFNKYFNIIGNLFENRTPSAGGGGQYWVRYGNSGASSHDSSATIAANPVNSFLVIRGNTFKNDTLTSHGQDVFHLKASGVVADGNLFDRVGRVAFRGGENSKFINNITIDPNTTRADHSFWIGDEGHLIANNIWISNIGSRTAIELAMGNTDTNGDGKLDYEPFKGKLYHNTFYGFNDEGIMTSETSSGNNDGTTTVQPTIVDFKNNVVYQTTGTMIKGTNCATLFTATDHNAWSGGATPDCITQSGAGNVTSAPQWVNPAAGDFHLQGTSPLINAGVDVAGVTEIDTDIEGNTRDSNPDIGAYEFGGAPPTPGDGVFYVDSSCGTQGNGTTTTCGANGPWTGLLYALETVDCAGMSAGDVIEVRGMTATPNQDNANWYSDYYAPVGTIDVDSACSGISVRPYSGATEHIVVDGSIDIKALSWSSIGSGVYESQATTLTAFPHRAWYKRGANDEETLDLIQSVKTCTSALAVDKMRYNPTTKTVCAHLSDGTSPASTTYFRVPSRVTAFDLTSEDVDNFSIESDGSATFLITRFATDLIRMNTATNQNITLKGLTLSEAGGAAIIADGGTGTGDYNIENNTIANIGETGIKVFGYLGSPTIIGNSIDGVGLAPNFEKCSGVGAGCQSGYNIDARAVWLNNCAVLDDVTRATVQDNTITNVGDGWSGFSYGIHVQDCSHANIIDSNLIADSTASSQTGFRGIVFTGIPAGQYHDHNRVTNNRCENVDYCFVVDYDTATDQSPYDNFIYGNTCHNPNTSCWVQQDGADVDGELWFKDNLASTDDGDGVLLMSVPSSTLWDSARFTHNAFECDHANCSAVTIATFQGNNYQRAGDCTPLTDCIEDINANNNIYGACNVTATSLDLPAGSACIDTGVNLGFLPTDYKKITRPFGSASDIGAHEYDGTTPAMDLTQTSFIFCERFAVDCQYTMSKENGSGRFYPKSQFNVRFAITGDAGTFSHVGEFSLYYQHCSPSCGSYTQITPTCSGNPICLVDDPSRENGEAITNKLTLGSRTFLVDSSFYDTLEDGININIAENDHLELEFSVGFCDVSGTCGTAAADDVYNLRVYRDDGTALDAYGQTPTLTVGGIHGTILQSQ